MSSNQTTDTMYIRSYEEPLMALPAYRAHKYIMLYVPPVLLVLGTIGNVLSVIILSRRSMRKMSAYFYLAVLSSADTVVLFVGLLRLWLGELTGRDIRDWSDWSCKTITFLAYIASDFSGWLIIAVTFERYLAVCFPFRAVLITRRDKAIKIAAGLFIVLALINIHFFWTVRIVYIKHDGDLIPQCHTSELAYTKLIDDIWPWVDACIYSFLPFVIILVLNTVIIRQVVKARRRRRLMRFTGRNMLTTNQPRTSRSETKRSPDRDSGKITVMLIAISFTFLLTTLPLNVSLIVTKFIIKTPPDILMVVNLRLMMTVTELLMYVNHSINFILYCATGKKFRAEILCLLTRPRTSNVPPPPPPQSEMSGSNPLRDHTPRGVIRTSERYPLRHKAISL